jgi:hypothetical protein
MSQLTFTQIIAGIQSLPPEDRAKVREILNAPTPEEQRIEAARALAHAASLRDLTEDYKWLKAHRAEYVGQWVALKDGQLISHGQNLKEVHAAAKASGHPDALLRFVEPDSDRPFVYLG